MGLRIQASFDRKQEATLSLFVAVLLVVVLWMACHGEKFLYLGPRLIAVSAIIIAQGEVAFAYNLSSSRTRVGDFQPIAIT